MKKTPIKKALLVNNSIKIYDTIKTYLRNEYKIDYINNSKEGLSLYNKNDYDLIIIDIDTPKLNSKQMITEIRKHNKDIPIIMLGTSITQSSDKNTLIISQPYHINRVKNQLKHLSYIYKYIHQYKKQDNNIVNKIIHSAEKEFAKKGFTKTTVDDIVKKAGTSKGSYYHHFKGKDDVIKFMITNVTYIITQTVEENIEKLKIVSSQKEYRKVIDEICVAVFLKIYDYKDIITILIYSQYILNAEVEKFKQENIIKINNVLAELIKIGIKKGYVEKNDINILTKFIFNLMIHFFISIVFKESKLKIKTYVESLNNFIFNGILKK